MITLGLYLPDYGNLLPSRPWEMVNGQQDLDILVKDRYLPTLLTLAWQTAPLHSNAFWLFLVHWGLDKPLLKIQGGHII